MCHIIFKGPVTTRPGYMVKAPAAAGLVTPSGLALRQQPGFLGTAFETVHLATIAMAADQYLCAAPPAEKQPGRHAGLIGATASAIRRSRVVFWTHPLLSAILIPHCAPARCRARRRTNCHVHIGAVPACNFGWVLPRQPASCQPTTAEEEAQSQRIWKPEEPSRRGR